MRWKFWKKHKDFTLQDFLNIAGWNSQEVIRNSNDAMEKSAWIYSAVRTIATKISTVPWTVRQIGKEDKSIEKAIAILKHPNQSYTFTKLLQFIQSWIELRGNAYLYVEYPYIHILDNDFLTIIPKDNGGYEFIYYPRGKETYLNPEQVVILQNYSPYYRDLALPTLSSAMPSAQLQAIAEKAQKNLFENGAITPLVLVRNKRLLANQVEELRKQWKERYGGYANAGSIPILPEGVEPKTLGLSFSDASVLLYERITKNRISTVFQIPPLYMNDLENTKYDSAPAQERVFVRMNIIPRLIDLQEQITLKLLPLLNIQNAEFVFNWKELPELQEDEKKWAETSKLLVSSGIMTVNEIRARKGLPEVPWGNTWYMPLNLVPAGEAKSISEVLAKIEKKLDTLAVEKKKSERTDLIWKLFVARTAPEEQKLAKVLMKFWKKQGEFVINYVNKQFPDFKEELDLSSFDDKLAKTIKPYLLAFMQEAGNEILAPDKQFNFEEQFKEEAIGVVFNMDVPEIQEWLKHKLMTSPVEINRTTKEDVLKILQEAVKNGDGIDAIARQIRNLFEQTYRHRAQTVARTEVISANNRARMIAAVQGGQTAKMWIAALDERTREWHAMADGQTVGINECFIVKGEPMLQPGDPSASADNVVNCRCTMTFTSEKLPVNNDYWTHKYDENDVADYLINERGWKVPDKEALASTIENVIYQFKMAGYETFRQAFLSKETLNEFISIEENIGGLLSRIIREAPRPEGVIYRGLALPNVPKIGETITVQAPTSFSKSSSIAKNFAAWGSGETGGVPIVIEVEAPPNSFYIDSISQQFSQEKEVVVNGTTFTIVDVKEEKLGKSKVLYRLICKEVM